jgi:hypothetical protein
VLLEDAQRAGIARATLRRAMRGLDVRALRVGGLGQAGCWMTALAPKALKLGDEWATPHSIFDPLAVEFGPFALDPAATPENARAARFFTRTDNGLQQPWEGPAFCNPPYSQQGAWIAKAASECDQRGVLVVCLLRVAPDTRAWRHVHAPAPTSTRAASAKRGSGLDVHRLRLHRRIWRRADLLVPVRNDS